jgi:hypothetical protein
MLLCTKDPPGGTPLGGMVQGGLVSCGKLSNPTSCQLNASVSVLLQGCISHQPYDAHMPCKAVGPLPCAPSSEGLSILRWLVGRAQPELC